MTLPGWRETGQRVFHSRMRPKHVDAQKQGAHANKEMATHVTGYVYPCKTVVTLLNFQGLTTTNNRSTITIINNKQHVNKLRIEKTLLLVIILSSTQ